MKDLLFGLMSFEDFIEWYTELGKLKIFWAKTVKKISLLDRKEDFILISVNWLVRNKVERALLAITETLHNTSEVIESLIKYKDSTKIIITPEDAFIDLNTVNAQSILYFWKTDAETLEPNENVRIEIGYDWNMSKLKIFENIQRQSWGFFIPPRLGNHGVILGYLNDTPVAMAYLNTHNFNIDYGIHVIRSHWRKRIGTRLLKEILKLARDRGVSNISIVRIFRKVGGTSSDIRALRFYQANNPYKGLSVYRLAV